MPDTSLGITYPSSTSHTRLWEHFQALAEDVDTILARKGYIAESKRATATGSITTTETVIQSVTFTAVAGVRYKVTATQSTQSTVAGDNPQIRLRWAAGASVTASGTELISKLAVAAVVSKGEPVDLVDTFVPNVNGQVTVGVTLVRNAGTGNVSSFGDSRQVNTILIEGI
ncbi:hypothetical protein [Micromonospora chalcea]|uniref:hypothetical protein n=1 Tax=Micromonospora chalcea TaxID=1874 RepID=UPI0038F6AA20